MHWGLTILQQYVFSAARIPSLPIFLEGWHYLAMFLAVIGTDETPVFGYILEFILKK